MNAVTEFKAPDQSKASMLIYELSSHLQKLEETDRSITARNIELLRLLESERNENSQLREQLHNSEREARLELAHISDLKSQNEMLAKELDEARDEVRLLVAEKKEAEHRQRKAESHAKQETKRAETKAQRVIRQDKEIKQLNHQLTLAKQQAKKAAKPEASTKHPSIQLADGAIEIQLAMNQVHIHKATEPQWLISSQQLNKEPDSAAVFDTDSMVLVRKSCDKTVYKQIEQAVNQLARIWRKQNGRLLTTDLEGPPKSALNKIWKAGLLQASELLQPEAVEKIASLPGVGDAAMRNIKAALKNEGLL